ncbi:haloalkane dehalogenase [Pseudonocardia sp. CA-142604]|uniref:haloalkane dehalogenase n=1 Tax=Pseudonocardia sp. CA-142604 TaxID=3240024 RepID=UPI003D925682
MRFLRTPDESFSDLSGFDFVPEYATIVDAAGGSLRMAYVTAGPPAGPVVLLLHGEPTWSFLYRSMLPVLVDAGFRVIAPDLVGFGRSDKPAEQSDHTFERHVQWLGALLFEALDLREITLLGHDWGGAFGLGLAAEDPGRFSRLVMSNTGIPYGHTEMPQQWWDYRRSIETSPDLRISGLISELVQKPLPSAALAAYDAPFPDDSYKAGPRAMPALVPTTPDHPTAAAARRIWTVLSELHIPLLCAFSDGEVFTKPMAAGMIKNFPGAAGHDHPDIPGAGHFVQEDAGPALARAVIEFVRKY